MKTHALLCATLVACGGGKPVPPTGGTAAPDPDPSVGAAEPAPPLARPEAPPAEPAPPKGNPRTDLISRQILFGNPERTNVQISPDGKRLAWLAPKDGVLNVFVAPLGKLDQAKAITAETARPVRIYFWTHDGKHLLVQQDVGGDENFHIFRVPADGGELTDLTPYKGARAGVIAVSEKKPKTILVGINDRDPKAMDVYAIDLATAKRTLVYENKENFASFSVDPNLELRLAAKNEPSGTTQLHLRKGGAWVAWDQIPYEDTETTRTMWIDPAGKTVYASDSRGRDTAAFYAIDLATKKKTLLAEDARADLGAAIPHPTKRTPQLASFTYDKTRWQVLDKSIQADVDGIAKLAGNAEWWLASRSLDDRTWIVGTSSDVAPASYHLWDRGKHAGTFLFSSQPALPTDKLARMHPVVIDARDGLKLPSYLTLPPAADPDGDGKANAPVPTLLWVHGGPWGRDGWGFNRTAQLFANRGYAVLQVNFRGSTGFGKAFVNAGDLQWAKKMHDDLLDAVAWATKSGTAAQGKIGIGGGSYGGYATLVGLTMTPEVFACGIDIVGPSNINTLLRSIPPYWTPMIARFKKRVGDFDTPDGKAALEAASPLTHAGKIKRPLLIGQGANDPRVKQAESEQIVAAMKKHGLPVTYAVFPDEGHGFARPENNIAFVAAEEAFLSAHLGGYYLPVTAEELAASSMQIKEGRSGIPGLPK
ncbi:MAG TPA: S9 family peptidase [Kofleriaceae bacterium]|nr:S9 family peptidase [Kofleriaceae bacterium]